MIPRTEQYNDYVARLFPEGKKSGAQNVTFQVTDACSLKCTYCGIAGSKILMSDYSYKNIEDIIVGDEVMGFEEKTEKGKQMTLFPTKVTHLYNRHSNVIKIKTTNGTTITVSPEHPIINGRKVWKRAEDYTANKDSLNVFSSGEPEYIVNIDSDDYIVGYVISCFLGDGCMFNGVRKKDGARYYKNRLAVKDTEIIDRCFDFLKKLNFNFYKYPFKISKKNNLTIDCLMSNDKKNYEQLQNLINSNLNINTNKDYLCGFLAGIIDTEGTVSDSIRIFNSNLNIIKQCEFALNSLGTNYVFDKDRVSKNCNIKVIRILSPVDTSEKLKLLLTIKNAVIRKSYKYFYGKSLYHREEVSSVELLSGTYPVYNFETDSHTYVMQNVFVHNCYQINKGTHKMSFETAKKFIEILLHDNGYLDKDTSQGVVIEFIGGEPFLEIDLINQITEYFIQRMVELNHPWATKFRISICSNGVAYFNPKVQEYIKKYFRVLSFSISIDGNKELHDSCRVFPDGSGSYDIAMAGVKHYTKVLGGVMGSKMTIAPQNIIYVFEAVKSLIENGYKEINLNCVYEKGWDIKLATELYKQLSLVGDYLLDNNLEDKITLSIFDESNFFKPKSEGDDDTWCFRGDTLILTPNGQIRIDSLNIEDNIETYDGNNYSINNIKKHTASNAFFVKIKGTWDLYTTSNHPFLAKTYKYIGNHNIKKYDNPKWVLAKDLSIKDKIGLYYKTFGEDIFNKKLAYIIGRYIGDGWYSTTYNLCCSYQESDYLRKKLEEANIKYNEHDYRTVKQFTLLKSNTELIDVLENIGKNASTKNIPLEIYKWKKEIAEELLQGYIDSDGYVCKSKNLTKINTVSPFLANDLLLLLRSLGYFPTCYLNKREGQQIIEGRTVNIKNRYEIYYKTDLPKECKSYHGSFRDENLKVVWSSIRKLSSDIESYDVYNLEIDKNHSYIANGAVVHNCGGGGKMVSVDYKGDIYPCIRYMESSLGNDVPPIIIGNVNHGILKTESEIKYLKCLSCVTRRTENDDNCYYCPIASGCSNCLAYDYQTFGTPDKRATFICVMHIARALANARFFNKYYLKHKMNKSSLIHVPEEWALEIISEDEWNFLKWMEKGYGYFTE